MNDRDQPIEPTKLPIARLFERSPPRLLELPAFQKILADFVVRCSMVMRESAALETTLALDHVAEMPAAEPLSNGDDAVCVAFRVPVWNARMLVALDRPLVHAVLDAMCGGAGGGQPSAGRRPLTGLETDIAGHIASAIAKQLSDALADVSPFEFRLEAVAVDPPEHEAPASSCFVVSLRLIGLEQSIEVVFPALPIQLARDKLTMRDPVSPPDLDPGWSRRFQQGVVSTEVELVALAAGPVLTLGDIARLAVGSLVELESASLRHVRLESGGEPVFEGRLGQARGCFTICLEAPLKSAT